MDKYSTVNLDLVGLLKNQYEVLGHGLVEGQTEIRYFTNGYPKKIFCNNLDEFLKEGSILQEKGIKSYVGINPRVNSGSTDSDVSHVTCLVIDIDPVRPKDSPSSDEQHKGALDLGVRITQDFGGSIGVSSGSGCHVYFPIAPIRVSNVDALKESVRKWYYAVKEKYENEYYKIDPIFDLSRCIRLWGSFNDKSKRVCRPLREDISIVRFAYSFSQERKEPEAHKDLPELDRRFAALCSANKRLQAILKGEIKYKSASEADYDFIRILAQAHFRIEEIKELFPKNPLGNKEPKKGDVERVVSKVMANSKSNSVSLVHHSDRYYKSLKTRKMGIRTGITPFDEMVSGLKPQKLYIFAARPNQGKTSLLVQMLTNIAESGHSCLLYPTEVGAEPIFDKILSRKTGLSLKKFQNGSFIDEDFKKIDGVRESIAKIPLTVVEDFSVSVDGIRDGLSTYAPEVLAVDYFQALNWQDPESVGEKAKAVRTLKEIACDYNIPVILMSQLNRTDTGKPDLSKLKGTGSLEELADVVSFIFRENVIAHPLPVDLMVMKSKYSATGIIPMNFFPSTCTFEAIVSNE